MTSRILSILLMGLLLAGCGSRRLDVQGLQRTYRLHVPDTYTGDSPVPLVIALHQFSDTAAGMEKLTGFDAVADREGFIVAYPQGRWRIWQVGSRDGTDDVAFIEALIDALALEFNVDPDRVYATGASAGGMMAQYLACETDRFAAIAPVMGSLERKVAEACTPRRIPVLTIHGDADPVIPYAGGLTNAGPGPKVDFVGAVETVTWWAARAGCPMLPVTVEITNPLDGDTATRTAYLCEDGTEVVHYRVAGGGHTWPGHANRYPRFIVGKTSQAFDATEVIWNFFQRHHRGDPPVDAATS